MKFPCGVDFGYAGTTGALSSPFSVAVNSASGEEPALAIYTREKQVSLPYTFAKMRTVSDVNIEHVTSPGPKLLVHIYSDGSQNNFPFVSVIVRDSGGNPISGGFLQGTSTMLRIYAVKASPDCSVEVHTQEQQPVSVALAGDN
jgi:hypothetical protein